MLDFIKRHWLAVTVAVVDVLVLVVLLVVAIAKQAKTAIIDIMVAPSDAKILLDGVEYKNDASYRIAPREYKVEITRPGFVSKEYTISATDGATTKVYDYLVGEDGSFKWYETNVTGLNTLKMVGQDAKAKEFLKKMSILDILPYTYSVLDENTMEYTTFAVEVDRKNCADRLCLAAVNQANSTRELIDATMKNLGYDMENYEVYYY